MDNDELIIDDTFYDEGGEFYKIRQMTDEEFEAYISEKYANDS